MNKFNGLNFVLCETKSWRNHKNAVWYLWYIKYYKHGDDAKFCVYVRQLSRNGDLYWKKLYTDRPISQQGDYTGRNYAQIGL
jgi:hypothetical protein